MKVLCLYLFLYASHLESYTSDSQVNGQAAFCFVFLEWNVLFFDEFLFIYLLSFFYEWNVQTVVLASQDPNYQHAPRGRGQTGWRGMQARRTYKILCGAYSVK